VADEHLSVGLKGHDTREKASSEFVTEHVYPAAAHSGDDGVGRS
jgi:hypothetical protein